MDYALKPALYLVSTPIGNLEDITLRALRILRNADIIACEDTRHSGILLKKLEIEHKKLISYHEHNESEQSKKLVELIKSGSSIALISDAGTPLISDPGFRIVALAADEGIMIVPVPGATSFVAALSASGMSVHRFTFAGFAPQKKGRQTFLKKISEIDNTVILFESTHRIEKLLIELFEIAGGERKLCIAREITKIHEEFLRGTIAELIEIVRNKNGLKGEIVVIIDGKN
ncbi:MAG: 16S rRNA (cytidine(1402)-2'-O)-methyltransferase [Candidatus Kapabacteria bacterium]|nr:16S rRNA (cytidine(1402)-2'-O)-methyltransferase [Ignavibacteriota bacterium]MCW5883474.1 16S rRNA (cytidine(1402)-2'-O)-methyltransferase [Candidatus Kapabacteria bacterium]